MSVAPPTDLGRASQRVAALVVLASAIGFGFDSIVILALGAGSTTDGYFLTLGIVLFAPTLFYVTATNVLVPLMARRGEGGAFAPAERAPLLLLGGGVSGLLLLLRQPLAVALAGKESAGTLVPALAVLAVIPLLSAISEVGRAALLASGHYVVTGGYLVARNSATVLTAIAMRPRTVEGLAWCTTAGYVVQFLFVTGLALRVGRGRGSPGKAEIGEIGRGLGVQALVFGLGYLPVVVERAVAQRLGEGLPTIFGYSYRIVSMLGSIAITSATVPAMRELGRALHAADPATLRAAVRSLYVATVRLALPATALLMVGARPLGLVLAPASSVKFATVLALYGSSLLLWVYVRPWTALAYAQFAAGPVLGITAVQCAVALTLQAVALVAGWPVLALAPPIAFLASAIRATQEPLQGRSELAAAVRASSRPWLSRLGLASAAGLATALFTATGWTEPRLAGILAGAVGGTVFGVLVWALGTFHRSILETDT